jgi:lipoprotein NlpI
MGGGPGVGRPPDISQMSPEERATRLYNRVMTLHAAGKTDSAEFFLPMALQSYQMLPTLDIDARYHMGVLLLTGGDPAGALAEGDSIGRLAPTHLFGFVLRAQASELQHDSRRAQQAYRDFLKNEAAERARALPEYTDHAQNLDSFHARAVEATGGRTKTGT